jgi:hypothetical protein
VLPRCASPAGCRPPVVRHSAGHKGPSHSIMGARRGEGELHGKQGQGHQGRKETRETEPEREEKGEEDQEGVVAGIGPPTAAPPFAAADGPTTFGAS